MKTPFWLLVGCAAIASAQEPIFRNGNELVIPLDFAGEIKQTAKLSLNGGTPIAVDLADAAVSGAVVVDLAGFGELKRVDWEVPGAAKKTVSPVPEVKSLAALPLTAQAAFIEPAGPPRILFPEAARLRAHSLTPAARSLPVQDITFPVVTESDLPVPASANYILVSRQSFAQKDANLRSLYLSYRKPVYDTKGGVESFGKFLVEVPLDPAWMQPGDQAISLPLDRFRIHTGAMLGSGAGGLAQGGQSADIDDEGRIYLNCPSDGAGLVRFNPHTGKFEAPPVDFNAECRRLLPPTAPWNRNWDRDLGELLVARGRVYILFARNYRVETSNGRFETCSGLISVPQGDWDDAERFRADMRLHLGCWEGAPHRLYPADVAPATYKRKVLAPTETRDGIYFAAASDGEGGPGG